jgi:Na+/H+ antiporter NhaD/arsenite permease-like protein
LLAIGVLQGIGTLANLAAWMDNTIGNKDLIAVAIGLLSAVVDNVPIVAATMKMYSIETFPMDSKLWEFIAYAAGTGGSCLIIGSAAGVAVMGMEKIDFIWYLKKISWLALIGYLAGALAYIAIYPIFAVH